MYYSTQIDEMPMNGKEIPLNIVNLKFNNFIVADLLS